MQAVVEELKKIGAENHVFRTEGSEEETLSNKASEVLVAVGKKPKLQVQAGNHPVKHDLLK